MRWEDYLELDFRDTTELFTPDRRDFLKLLGGGIFVFFFAGDTAALQERRRRGFGRGVPADFNAFLRIGEDGRVTCFTGKIEMGQGVITSLAQMLAEELNVPMASVDMVMGDTDRCPWDMGTFGSMTTRYFGPALRAAAAEARAVLKQIAAERLGVPVAELVVEGGAVHPKGKREEGVSFAALTKGRQIARHVKGAVPEPPSAYTLVGRPVKRTDAREKVTGAARFAADIRRPGMLYAAIVRPQAHGAKLKSLDTSAVEKVPGARVVEAGEITAVLHERPDLARKALRAVKAEFEEPEPAMDDRTIFEYILEHVPAEGRVVAEGGDLAEGEAKAVKVLEGTYTNAYVSHAPVEPHAAVAEFKEGKLTVWASTQAPFRVRDELARTLELSPDKVRVIAPFVGGGFGGKTPALQAVEAALLARACGRPVQVAWTRKEEFFFDTFRPAAVVKIRSGLDAQGRIAFWDYHVYCAGSRGAPQFYDIPHHRTVSHDTGRRSGGRVHPFSTGAWRAPANNTNTHARESHIDALAALAGQDPIAFRLAHLKEDRLIRTLRAAAETFGWKPGRAPSGRGYGVACGTDVNTWVATLAEAEVDRESGHVRVKRVVCAQEMGQVVNPEGARLQMEGCISMGLGYALSEGLRFRGGKILDRNFGTYKLPRFSWIPEIETVLLDDPTAPPHGGGEPAIITMGGVVANAIYDATGVRLYHLPMTPERVKAALADH